MDFYVNGQHVILKKQGLDLLKVLHANEGNIVSYEEVDRILFGMQRPEERFQALGLTGTRSRAVNRLKKQLDAIEDGSGDAIKIIRRTGLVLEPGIISASSAPASAYQAPRLSRAAVGHLRNFYRPEESSDEAALGGKLLTPIVPDGILEYPVVFFPAHPDQTISTILPQARVDARESESVQRDKLRICDPRPRIEKYIRAHPGQPFDRYAEESSYAGWNLCMTKMRRSNANGYLELSARLAKYGDIMDSSDCLIDEISRAVAGGSKLNIADLRLRGRLGRTSLIRPDGRAAGIGMAALVAYVDPDNGELHALIGRRSYNVGTYADTWHVIPAGMLNFRFNTTEADGREGKRWGSYESTDIAYSIISEYAEEAFRKDDELDGNQRRAAILEQESVKWLMEQDAEIFVTGVAVDLGNLRPEICILIYVRGTWIDAPAGRGVRGSFVLNDEYLVPTGVRALQLRKPLLLPDGSGGQFLNPADTVPSGAAAFWAGSDLALKIYNDDREGGRWRAARGDRFAVTTALRRPELPFAAGS